MKQFTKSDTASLLSFFITIIMLGTFALCLPIAWSGILSGKERLPVIDALFTATSAVCVTGLVTVDTADFTRFGQVVIMVLIQTGGLGIISFTSIMLIVPGRRLSFRRLRTIKGFSISGVEHDPVKIVRDIIFFTILVETLGAMALYSAFRGAGVQDTAFTAVFHSISAFCNAGFSLFPDNMEGFKREPFILIVLSFLIVTGGIGFIVLQDLVHRISGKKKNLSYHTKLILISTLILILSGALAFWFLEENNTFAGMGTIDRAVNSIFQSITPRTAGFNAVHQASLKQPSKFITMILMFIGGAPGSIAGGIKIATAYIVLLVILKRANYHGEINAFGKRISRETINAALVYFIKAIFLLMVAVGALSLLEVGRGADLEQITFEVVSAFGTVGLSLDFSTTMSFAGKLVIIVTMYAGRVGLLAFIFLGDPASTENFVYPEADILIG